MMDKVYDGMGNWENIEDTYKKACMKVGKRMLKAKC